MSNPTLLLEDIRQLEAYGKDPFKRIQRGGGIRKNKTPLSQLSTQTPPPPPLKKSLESWYK